eukprot:scaffold339_cov402-Prasinococcus_capsulatus_cf.AAC.24
MRASFWFSLKPPVVDSSSALSIPAQGKAPVPGACLQAFALSYPARCAASSGEDPASHPPAGGCCRYPPNPAGSAPRCPLSQHRSPRLALLNPSANMTSRLSARLARANPLSWELLDRSRLAQELSGVSHTCSRGESLVNARWRQRRTARAVDRFIAALESFGAHCLASP